MPRELDDPNRENRVAYAKKLLGDVHRLVASNMDIGEHYAQEMLAELEFLVHDRGRMRQRILDIENARAPAEQKMRLVTQMEERVEQLERERGVLTDKPNYCEKHDSFTCHMICKRALDEMLSAPAAVAPSAAPPSGAPVGAPLAITKERGFVDGVIESFGFTRNGTKENAEDDHDD